MWLRRRGIPRLRHDGYLLTVPVRRQHVGDDGFSIRQISRMAVGHLRSNKGAEGAGVRGDGFAAVGGRRFASEGGICCQ